MNRINPTWPQLVLSIAFGLAVISPIAGASAASWQDDHDEPELHPPEAAQDEGHGHEADPHDTAGHDDHDDHDDHDEHGSGADGHHEDAGMIAAHDLAVHEPPDWYSGVITGVIVLFALAATLGSIAVLAKGPEPEDAAAHDDHGHDHGHGH